MIWKSRSTSERSCGGDCGGDGSCSDCGRAPAAGAGGAATPFSCADVGNGSGSGDASAAVVLVGAAGLSSTFSLFVVRSASASPGPRLGAGSAMAAPRARWYVGKDREMSRVPKH
jgi:hypothetical protein